MPNVERRIHSDEFKRKALKALATRGDKPVKEVAADLQISQALLYNWKKRVDNNEPLSLRPSKKNGAALVVRPPQELAVARSAMTVSRPPVYQVLSGNEELLLLREENRRLRAMIEASLTKA